VSGMPVSEQLSEQDGGLFNRVFGRAPGEPPAESAARFLGSATLSHSANNGVRVVALKRAQQTHGNHFAQRVVRAIQRKPASSRIVQRECAYGSTSEKYSATSTSYHTHADVVGRDGYFAAGKYAPQAAGRPLGPELVHAVRQGDGAAPFGVAAKSL